MKLKMFTLRFSENVDGFNDEPLQEFIADKEVIEFSEHFFVHEKTPYLTVVFAYRDISPDEKRKPYKTQDPRSELDEKEKRTYDALRAWRAAKASQEGIPPYMVANNRQIAGMVKLKAQTKADLGKVKGFGEAKINRYGEDMLKILSSNPVNDSNEANEIMEGET